MNKKFKFSSQPKRVKIIYTAVIGVLCVTAVVIGIVSAASKKTTTPLDEPVVNIPSTDDNIADSGDTNGDTNGENQENQGDTNENNKPEKISFVSPIVGEVVKSHSIDTPVFSNTLNEWRVHTGIDISAAEGANVYCAADGVVSRVYNDPLFGKSVEITHEGGISSIYSNLSTSDIGVTEGQTISSGSLL